MERLERLQYDYESNNQRLNSINYRLGNLGKPVYHFSSVNGINGMNKRLLSNGGFPQQDRMIKDKRRSLDRATLYSYQAAWVRKCYNESDPPELDDVVSYNEVRALINPNKLKPDYDDKVISVGFEHGFKTGDVFEWCNTGSYWLIYLQDLTELAYFRGDIRKCSYEISWLDESNNLKKTYIALRGPVETKIDYIQKHQISVDNPNYSLNFMLPKNEDTLKYFRRYSKFYLQGLHEGQENTCWRVEAVDSYSTPNIIEVNAVEYYSNETEDDLEQGLVGALTAKPLIPNPDEENNNNQIFGEIFIKPKKEYIYYVQGYPIGQWVFSNDKLPIISEEDYENGNRRIKIKWNSSYSGQFDLIFQPSFGGPSYDKKTIVVESLF